MSLSNYEIGYSVLGFRHQRKISEDLGDRTAVIGSQKFATLNIGTMTGKREEVVERMMRKQLLVMGVQERDITESSPEVDGKDTGC